MVIYATTSAIQKHRSFVNYKKGCTRLATASDKAYQLLAHGRWFSPASSTIKTGRHDIAEILLKVVLKHQKSKSLENGKIYHKSEDLAFLKKWWVESDFKAPNLPLSLRFKGSGCHYNSHSLQREL
jgi:hypothetical protein